MDFFDKIGEKASKTYKITAEKTSKIAKEAKLKMKMNELKAEANDVYKEIGKKVYEKHIREEDIKIKEDLEEQCTKLDVLSGQIESLLKECLELKDKKQCPKCHKEIEKDAKFCPECGERQNEEKAREVEIVENENSCENLSKTVEVEAAVNNEENKQ